MNMKVSISVIVLCTTILLAARESHAKKGCNAYGHACYGGHGKRSLGPLTGSSSSSSGSGSSTNMGYDSAIAEGESTPLRSNSVIEILPNDDDTIFIDTDDNPYPKYRLIKIIKSWFDGTAKRQLERTHHLD